MLAALKLGVHLAWRAGRISDHDAVVGRALATCSRAASLPHQTTVSEQYLLDLEREAFLKLVRRAQDAGADPAHVEDRQAVEKLSRMPLREIQGSAGRLEALLDEPAPSGASAPTACWRRATAAPSAASSSGIRTLIRRHDAHQGRVSGGEGAQPNRMRGAALQLPWRGASAGSFEQRARRARGLSRRRSTSWPSAIPRTPLWAAGMSFGAWVALDVGAGRPARRDAHRHRAAAVALRLRTRSRAARSRSSSSRASSTRSVR